MKLGERIAFYRKKLGLSQEALGEHLGVSRQAVSKWETGAAAPDMENLMALAREFHIPLSELTETPEETAPVLSERPHALWYFLLPVLCAMAGAAMVGMFLMLRSGPPANQPAAPPPEGPAVSEEPAPPVPAPESDFAFLWINGDGREEFLELGEQEDFFPFGTTLELTAPEKILDTDFRIVKHHIADCGAVTVEYDRIEEGPVRESVTKLTSILQSVYTPRYIGPGTTERALLNAYGDELIYCLKEGQGYTLIPHEYFYEYCQGALALSFYIRQGEVVGLAAENRMDGADLSAIDYIYRFPVINGEPDFSLRQEPPQEEISDTRRVYIAFNQLVTNNNLSAEERYAYRRDVFGLLPFVDWQEYMVCSGTYEQPDIGFFALMDWMARQDTYSPSEILWLQMGCAAKGLDGAYTDMYAQTLCRAMLYDPVEFCRQLAVDGTVPETTAQAMILTAYSADSNPVERDRAVEIIRSAVENNDFTQQEQTYAELFASCLAAPLDERPALLPSP